VRDLRKYKHASHIDIDLPALRTVLAIPIRVQRQSVGAILAFGKQKEIFFSENDESLAGLLSSQAAAAIESAWLSNEVRENLTSATQLYQLSSHIIQAQELNEAARYIAEAAQKVSGANSSGILLLTPDNEVEAEAHLDASGTHVTPAHPMHLIHQAMNSGQSIFTPSKDQTYSICFPLKTSSRMYGALWLHLPNRSGLRFATNLQTLANQAAVALERLLLLAESRDQARGLESAYRDLETSYDHTLAALMSALDARDRETEGHSLRVARLACKLGEYLDLTSAQLKSLERGSLLHDIGKIGIRDTILLKPGPLDPAEWEIMRTHPSIGARIVEGIPFLEDTQAVIRYHQERWDGSGYPLGLSGKDIPYLARIFAVADALDALTSDRPYRPGVSREEALTYLHEQAGILFDPQVISVLETTLAQESFKP
jgi:putative nucleotidyltransferase with HDIG domain